MREFLKALFGTHQTPDAQNQSARQAEEQREVPSEVSDVEIRVRQIVAEEFKLDLDTVTRETNLYIEGDSVGSVEVIMAFEEVFEIEIPDQDAEHLATVAQIVDYIQRRQAETK